MTSTTTDFNVTPPENLETVVSALFGGSATTLTLNSGRVVTFQQAKFKQVAKVTQLFQTLLDRIPKDKFLDLLGAIAGAQASAMTEGRSADDISMNAVGLLEKAFGQNSVLLTMFAAVMDVLPQFIPQFSDLSSAEFEELEIDEALLVASGVVAVNYSFFTQKLPPLLKSVIGGWQSKQGGKPSSEK